MQNQKYWNFCIGLVFERVYILNYILSLDLSFMNETNDISTIHDVIRRAKKH